jgi:hypothetical protein
MQATLAIEEFFPAHIVMIHRHHWGKQSAIS